MSNKLDQDELEDIYAKRFRNKDNSRGVLWKTLVDSYFQRYVKEDHDVVLDLAAGYCEFINNIKAKKKYAVDLNRETLKRADKDVEVIIASSDRLPKSLHNKVDVLFVSNFFEHLDNKHQLLKTLKEIHNVLKPGGRLLILQPNISKIGGAYWDFIDHSLPINHKSLREALELSGFSVNHLIPAFLPYTTSSGIPFNRFLIKLYLRVSLIQRILGKQIFAVASPKKT